MTTDSIGVEMDDPEFQNVTFTVTCSMKRRWARQFLGMLKWFQMLGSVGASREITFFADGDGDFRPKFALPADIDPAEPCPLEYLDTDWKKRNPDKYSAYFDAG